MLYATQCQLGGLFNPPRCQQPNERYFGIVYRLASKPVQYQGDLYTIYQCRLLASTVFQDLTVLHCVAKELSLLQECFEGEHRSAPAYKQQAFIPAHYPDTFFSSHVNVKLPCLKGPALVLKVLLASQAVPLLNVRRFSCVVVVSLERLFQKSASSARLNASSWASLFSPFTTGLQKHA